MPFDIHIPQGVHGGGGGGGSFGGGGRRKALRELLSYLITSGIYLFIPFLRMKSQKDQTKIFDRKVILMRNRKAHFNFMSKMQRMLDVCSR